LLKRGLLVDPLTTKLPAPPGKTAVTATVQEKIYIDTDLVSRLKSLYQESGEEAMMTDQPVPEDDNKTVIGSDDEGSSLEISLLEKDDIYTVTEEEDKDEQLIPVPSGTLAHNLSFRSLYDKEQRKLKREDHPRQSSTNLLTSTPSISNNQKSPELGAIPKKPILKKPTSEKETVIPTPLASQEAITPTSHDIVMETFWKLL
jgi:hypothetical protein